MREAISDFARVQPPSARVWDRFAQALFYYAGDPADAAIYPGLDRLRAARSSRSAAPAATGSSTSRRRPSLYPHLVTQLGEAGLNRAPEGSQRLGAHHHREAVRPRSRVVAARSTSVVASVVQRGPGLPDRPLPRARRPSRTSSSSASPTASSSRCGTATTSTTCRSRSARRIGVEARGALLRGVGRAPRHDPEPHPAAPVPGRDGAAGHLRRRPGARREEQGDARDPADRPPTTWTRRRARPVRPRLRGRPARARLSRGEGRLAATRSPRPTRRSSSPSTTGGGRACRSICAPASACPSARARSRCSSSARRTWSSAANPEILAEPNLLVLRIQPDEGIVAVVRRQAARARAAHQARSRWTSTTARPSAASRPRPTSGCCSTR